MSEDIKAGGTVRWVKLARPIGEWFSARLPHSAEPFVELQSACGSCATCKECGYTNDPGMVCFVTLSDFASAPVELGEMELMTAAKFFEICEDCVFMLYEAVIDLGDAVKTDRSRVLEGV